MAGSADITERAPNNPRLGTNRAGAGNVVVEMGLSPGSDMRLKRFGSQFIHADAAAKAQAVIAVNNVTDQFVANYKRLFAMRHDTYSTGNTLSSIRVQRRGLEDTVTIGGAAELIETGAPEHEIWPSSVSMLMFNGMDGEITWAPHVDHPGFQADPVAEDAANEIDMQHQLNRIGVMAYTAIKVTPTVGEMF